MQRPEVAYIYPAPYWGASDGGWIKSLLLFFDKVSILLPDYMYGQHHLADPALAEPLEDQGLLEVLEPKSWIDEEIAESLAEAVSGLLDSGAFDNLPKVSRFHELSQSRIGYGADLDLAQSLVSKLRAKGLAKPTNDGVSIPLHPHVRATILVILAQLARVAGNKRNLSVHPATNDHRAVRDLIETLSRETMPSRAKVIALDVEPAGFDMSTVPLDELLQFKEEHKEAHRAYVRDLRGFVAELAEIDNPKHRESQLLQRRHELADASHELQTAARRSLGKNLRSLLLGIVGTACSISTGDPIGIALGALGLGSNVLDFKNSGSASFSAYSYVYRIEQSFG